MIASRQSKLIIAGLVLCSALALPIIYATSDDDYELAWSSPSPSSSDSSGSNSSSCSCNCYGCNDQCVSNVINQTQNYVSTIDGTLSPFSLEIYADFQELTADIGQELQNLTAASSECVQILASKFGTQIQNLTAAIMEVLSESEDCSCASEDIGNLLADFEAQVNEEINHTFSCVVDNTTTTTQTLLEDVTEVAQEVNCTLTDSYGQINVAEQGLETSLSQLLSACYNGTSCPVGGDSSC